MAAVFRFFCKMLAPAMPSLPPPGCSFSLFALSEFFTIHFSSFAWDRFNSGFHPFTASQIANPHSPLVFQCLLKKLLPSSSSRPPPFPPRLASPRLASVPSLSLPAASLFLLLPLSLFISLSLPSAPLCRGGGLRSPERLSLGWRRVSRGRGAAGGGAGRERGHRSCRSCWESARADHKAAAAVAEGGLETCSFSPRPAAYAERVHPTTGSCSLHL